VRDAIGIDWIVNRANTCGKAQRQGGAGGREQKAKWAGHTFIYVILVGVVNVGGGGRRKIVRE
jgi:hypothetical protein